MHVIEPIQQGLRGAGSGSLLERSIHLSPKSQDLSPVQQQVDGLAEGFVRESTRLSTLGALTGAGFFYRLGRAGVLSAGLQSWLKAPLSVVTGLGAEVTSYEMIHRSLLSFTPEGRQNPHLFHWDGEGGLHNGLLTSLITFTALKGAGNLAREENFLFQHAIQDTAMVLGHRLAAAGGFVARPQGTLAEQYLHAEATNWQLGAGTSLLHGLAPGWIAWERSLDITPRLEGFRRNPFRLLTPPLAAEASPRGAKVFSMHREFEARGSVNAEETAPLVRVLQGKLERELGRGLASPSEILETLIEPAKEPQGEGDAEKQEVLKQIERDFQSVMQEGKGVSVNEYYLAVERLLFIAEHRVLYSQFGLKGLFLRNVLGLYDRPRFNPMPQWDSEFWYPAGKKGIAPAPTPYSPEAEAWMNALEPQLRRAKAELPHLWSKEEFSARRIDENLVNRVWFYQLLHFAEQIGAEVSVVDASRLADSFHPEASSLDSDVLDRALAKLEEAHLDPLARKVFELKIPYQNVTFGKRKDPEAVKASVPHLIAAFQNILGAAVRLKHVHPDGTLSLRIASPSVLERLLETVQGEKAPLFYYLDGEVSRDEMMRARELGVAPIGFVRNPVILGDVDALVPSWAYPFHDIFHAFMVSQYGAPLRQFAASLYRLGVAQAPSCSPLAEAHWNRLVDYDQAPKTYLEYTIKHVLEDSSRTLLERMDYVKNYQKLLETWKPTDPFQAIYLQQFQKELARVETKLARKRNLGAFLDLILGGRRR